MIIAFVGIGISVLLLLTALVIFRENIINGTPIEPNSEFLDHLIQNLEAASQS